MIEYNGYLAEIELDDKAEVFHGRVINTRDVITFEGTSIEELRQAFKDSVDDYFEFCKELGQEPEKPYSGKFLVRLDPKEHRQVALAAKISGKSLNSWVVEKLLHAASKELGKFDELAATRADNESSFDNSLLPVTALTTNDTRKVSLEEDRKSHSSLSRKTGSFIGHLVGATAATNKSSVQSQKPQTSNQKKKK